MPARYAIGIDLGTTNSVLGYTDLESVDPAVQVLSIPQLVAPGTIESRRQLPSFLYIAPPHEGGHSAWDLPWTSGRNFALGEVARRQAAESPERIVSGAKSWLCHSRVDRREPILPWGAGPHVAKISPVTASQRYLEHLVAAWQQSVPDAPIERQMVVLAVPASFDAAARELTREAALAAGLPDHLVLLEEPQAAVYAWLDKMGQGWRRILKAGQNLLICDVGGGTTDLTLIGVAEEAGELELRRQAVGNHLLVGGDNMDLALAHFVAGKFLAKGIKLDPWQSVSLWHSCRAAKESLLSVDGPRSHPISVLGRGSKLIGGTVSMDLEREAVAELLVNGFFPHCGAADRPTGARVSGFRELGLNFESDTAITRHVAAFLQAHHSSDGSHVTHVLFNGGVFKADLLRTRLLEVLGQWSPTRQPPHVLDGQQDLDFAVARGAAFYGWNKHRGGIRIRGGTGRAYYVGVETSGLAIPGAPRPLRGLCVVPFGMEEGTQVDVPAAEIGVVVGQPAHFRFFSSAIRKEDKPGDILDYWTDEELLESDSLEATLPAGQATDDETIPVKFQSRVTELGMFELWCVSTRDSRRWKLEFNVRKDAEL